MGGSLRSLLARSTLLGRSFTSKTLLKLCAVPGDPQAKELVEDEELVHNLLDRAVQAGLIKEQRQRFVYKHDLIRVVIITLESVCISFQTANIILLRSAATFMSTMLFVKFDNLKKKKIQI